MTEHHNQVPIDAYGTFEARLEPGDWTPQIVYIDPSGEEFALRFIGGAKAVQDLTSRLALEAAALFKDIRAQGWLDVIPGG